MKHKDLDCDTCSYRSKCRKATDRYAVCFAQGKPWEPQDDRNTVQASDQFWEKQHGKV